MRGGMAALKNIEKSEGNKNKEFAKESANLWTCTEFLGLRREWLSKLKFLEVPLRDFC